MAALDIQAVTISRQGQLLEIEPPVEGLRTIGARQFVGRQTPNGFRVRKRRIPLFDDFGTCLRCCGGLEPVIVECLRSQGYNVRINQSPQLCDPDDGIQMRFNSVDERMLRHIQMFPNVLVRVDVSRIDNVRLAGQIALAWPRFRIAVIVPGRDEGRHFARRLSAYVHTKHFRSGMYEDPDQRVVVISCSRAGYNAADLVRADIIICTDALRVLGERGREILHATRHARLVGLMPMQSEIAFADQFRLREMFGFHDVSIPRHGEELLPVDIATICHRDAPRSGPSSELLDLKRSALWHNPTRNRRIARLTQSLAGGDRDKALRLCLELRDFINKKLGERLRVAILVESQEHRAELLRAGATLMSGLDSSRRLVSLVDDVKWCDFDVVVRADGGFGFATICDSRHAEQVLSFGSAPAAHRRYRPRSAGLSSCFAAALAAIPKA